MKNLPRLPARVALIGAVVAWLASSADAATSLFDWLFPQPELQTITVTDLTPQGRLMRPPSPSAPLYYTAINAGYLDLGGIIAGEHSISHKEVNHTMLKVLAKQGLLPAPAGRTPDVVLMWRWGTMNVQRMPTGDPSYAPQINERAMLRFLGGDKIGINTHVDPYFADFELPPGLLHESTTAEALRDVAHDNLFIVHIAAYAPHLDEHGRPIQLWNTRISAPSKGYWLPEALPSMIVMAGPCIGRETTAPVWVRASERFHAEVLFGDLKVLEFLDHSDSAVLDAGKTN